MYPIAQFRTVARRAGRRGAFTALAAVGTLVLFAFTALDLSDPWGRSEPTPRVVLVWGTVAAAGLTLAFEVAAKLARHPYLHCPHCRKGLADHSALVIASGCCPHCGRRVLDPPPDESPPDALIPRPDYLAADTAYQRRGGPVLAGGMLACYLGLGGAAISLERLRLPFPLNWAVFAALALAAPVSLVAVVRWLAAGGKRNPALVCPTCGKLLAGARMLVAATGNCADCGGRAVVPRTRPLPPPHLGRPWTVPRLTERERHRRRHTWRMLVLLAVMTAATYGLVILGKLMWEEERLRQMGLNRPAAQWVERYGAWVAAAVGVTVAVVVARLSLRAAARRHPLDCPRCGRELLPPFARATKCCNRCGWAVVATSSPPAA